MAFNEDSRVKIPTILHLIALGYTYLPLKGQKYDKSTNIFTEIFKSSLLNINKNLEESELEKIYAEISLSLENEDLGKSFYNKLIDRNGVKLIDFENFDNNSFHVVTELPCQKDDEEFRPDITLLINGMPLVFIEVKKPNNKDGILDEHRRMDRRFKNKKFRKFINITQLMIFSNNMEYDDSTTEKIQGAFYSSTAYKKPMFNFLREEEEFILEDILRDVTNDEEDLVLKDNNLVSIKNSDEFITNKSPYTPTNRICSSLVKRDRLAFILEFAIAYVKDKKGLQKHVMRYPQMFGTKAIESMIAKSIDKGIIWHTQGSGKTALAYYSVRYLTEYFRKKGIIPKFYFIVDRLDLLTQAGREFRARDLVVNNINSKEDFAKEIKSTSAIQNNSGKTEITVVNIHKFKDDPSILKNSDYQLNIQRVYFLDEVHRSYNPEGSFLANLIQSDKNAIKVGLTGTPLIQIPKKNKKGEKIFSGKGYDSKKLFGNYIHKYYYNASIKDGYTLRLIREEIATNYKMVLQKALEEINILKGNSDRKKVYAHRKFVEPMLKYIVEDFESARIRMDDNSIGGMVVCDSSEQAKMMYQTFQENYSRANKPLDEDLGFNEKKNQSSRVCTAEVILHDIGTKEDRKNMVEDFKDGKVDFLFVYNMLLTGFDAPRLKKLYVGRVIESHNLLQMLTRVNRTYKDFRYGYVVDFADIQKEFDKTNRAYFDELQSELGSEIEHYTNLFKSQVEIDEEITQIKDVLFHFDTQNAEVFSQQISQIDDRKEMLKITKVLNDAKSLYNLIRLSGDYDMLEKLDFKKLTILSREANNRLALINAREALESNVDTTNLLNIALEDVMFAFTKVSEAEMILADQLKDILQKTREGLGGNFDQKDPVFISLKCELERLFKKKKLNEVTKEEMEKNIEELNEIYNKAKELERKNQLLKAKYDNDEKYARLHKRLMEKDPLTESESKLFDALTDLKKEVDSKILNNSKMLENENFVEKMIQKLVIDRLKNEHHLDLDVRTTKRINGIIVKEYLDEYYGRAA